MRQRGFYPWSAFLEAVLMRWDHEVVIAQNGQEAWEVLQAPDAPYLAILDWMTPGLDGVEVCRTMRRGEQGKDTDTYLILLTAKGAIENIVTGMEAGADDYIVQPFDRNELRVHLCAGQRIIELQAELLASRQRLLIQSRTGPGMDAQWRGCVPAQTI